MVPGNRLAESGAIDKLTPSVLRCAVDGTALAVVVTLTIAAGKGTAGPVDGGGVGGGGNSSVFGTPTTGDTPIAGPPLLLPGGGKLGGGYNAWIEEEEGGGGPGGGANMNAGGDG